jgi:membrane protein
MRFAKPRVVLWLVARAFRSAFNDNCFNIAKAAAYSATLSVFPGLLLVAALLFRGNAANAISEISAALGQVLPPRVHGLITQYLSVPERHSLGWLVGAASVALLAAAQWMASLM